MAELAVNQDREVFVPLDHKLECPVCKAHLIIEAIVKIEKGSVSDVGGSMFHRNLSVYMETNVTDIVVQKHQCKYRPKED